MLVIYISIMIFSVIIYAVGFFMQSDCITVLSMVAFMISSILVAVEVVALKNKIEEAKGCPDDYQFDDIVVREYLIDPEVMPPGE